MNGKFLLISILLVFSQILFSQTINYKPPEGIVEISNSLNDNLYNYQDSLGFISIQIKIINDKNFENLKKNFDTNKFFEKNNLIPQIINTDFKLDDKNGILLKGNIFVNEGNNIVNIIRTTYLTGDESHLIILTAAYPNEIDEIFFTHLIDSFKTLEIKN
jgi:hypothetical protein